MVVPHVGACLQTKVAPLSASHKVLLDAFDRARRRGLWPLGPPHNSHVSVPRWLPNSQPQLIPLAKPTFLSVRKRRVGKSDSLDEQQFFWTTISLVDSLLEPEK